MKPSEIRALSSEQRAEKLSELYKKEASIKLNIGQENFTKTHKLSEVKRDIARIITIDTEITAKEGAE